jgi:cysteinyl-tRNA synthetase
MQPFYLYNTLSGEKELFKPISAEHVGMYVCGPTVYSDVHLGNCRTFTSFDILFRLLKYIGYKVRYVRNITDVGHLEGDSDIGAEDKIQKKARLEQLEPMEIVQRITNGFHHIMHVLNNEDPSIEPTATGHLMEQIAMVQQILDNGYAYIQNGSVYFDTIKFAKETGSYGQISGRKIEDLLVETRDDLKNQSEKRHPSDFAIWIKADPSHIMKWESKWSTGFPGWHLECSAMSTKYLGAEFDIHGGGQDLKFPHHENEVAQNLSANHKGGARYWMHANMLLLNGKKMSKSEGNSVTPTELFNGENTIFPMAFSPMELRFYMLQSHYRNTLDLTSEGLTGSTKGFKRLKEAYSQFKLFTPGLNESPTALSIRVNELVNQIESDLCDDLNTPKAIAGVFEIVTIVNQLVNKQVPEDEYNVMTHRLLDKVFFGICQTVLGLILDEGEGNDQKYIDGLMNVILDIRSAARTNKDWTTSDLIRGRLTDLGIQVKDGSDGASWSFN